MSRTECNRSRCQPKITSANWQVWKNLKKRRKIIGKGFIDVFDEEAHKIKDVKWLAQGTIYPDCIESLSITGTVIKSHHNVGGLPEKNEFETMRASASAIQG